MTAPTSPRIFDVPGSRLCIETMQSWMAGDRVWPYERIISTWGAPFENWRKQIARHFAKVQAGETDGLGLQHNPELHAALYEVRAEYVARYGFMIPCAELLDALEEHQPIAEIGAGSGYMTRLMRNRGIDVIGTDIDEPGASGHGFHVGEHDAMQIGRAAGKQAVRRFPERTVFCSWPTYQATWFRQALRAMRIGQRVIVTREDCIATPETWDYLDACFEELQVIELPVFPYIHDFAGVYRKVRQNAQTEKRTSLLGRRRSLPRRAPAANRQ